MKKLHLLITALFTVCLLHAQRPEEKPKVFIMVNNTPAAMTKLTTQTEVKRGWEIQGITVGKKNIRYIWGQHAKQLAEVKPTFAIYPTTENLNDYAVIRMKNRPDHRAMPSAELKDCNYKRVELAHFKIENLPNMGFAVTPLEPLFYGEYILVNLAQKPVNEQGDIEVYDFRVVKQL